VARITRIISTTAFKLSAIYLTVFTAFAVMFAVTITYAANQVLNQQINEAISTEFFNLSEDWNRGGALDLITSIEQRSRLPGASLYLLTDATGRVLAGNVSQVSTEELARAISEPTAVDYQTAQGEDRLAMVQVARLPGGLVLMVGRDMAERERFGDIIRIALVIAAVLLIGLAAVSWFFVSRRVLRRIDSVSATTRQIMAGDLTGRLEVTGTNDEFDRLAASLNTMLERIELLLKSLKEVTDNIAHDLRTPLTRMRNRIERVIARSDDAEERDESLRAAIDEADQLIATFDSLLTIARLEAGASDAGVDEIDAAEIARDVAELYEPVAEEAGVDLVVDAKEEAVLQINRELLSQAVANLVDNAIKHGQPPAEGGARREVRIAVAKEGGDVTIAVIDNGPGIPQSERGRVLQRFVRLEESRSTPGTGLGLSLAAAAVKLRNGSIELSDAGPGLAVTLRLPAGAA
jgi:signal transduction histidine kinase